MSEVKGNSGERWFRKAAGAAALFVLVAAQVTIPATSLAATGTRQVEPRFETAWTDLNSALWMLTHTDAVRAKDPNYKQTIQAVYAAIGAMDDGIMDSTHRASAPKAAGDGRARLHAAVGFLTAADRLLGPPSQDRTAEPLRVRALARTREAIAAARALIADCRC